MDPPALELQRVCFAYPLQRVVLQEVSLAVYPGERVALVGPNGAGKTTLFLCAAGVLQPQSGSISVMGLNPERTADRRQLPQRLGVIFQDSDDQIFSTTVLDDVAFGPINLGLPITEVRERAFKAMRQVGLEGFEQRVPHHLSGGEKRRVALAGVLAMEPAVMLLDEPTAFLDPKGRRMLLAVLRSLPQTMLIASHDLEFVLRLCHRAIVMDGGRIVAEGQPSDVFSRQGLMDVHGLEVPASLALRRNEESPNAPEHGRACSDSSSPSITRCRPDAVDPAAS